MTNARDVALQVLVKIDAHRSYSNIALDRMFMRFTIPKRERAFATEIVYGVTRHRRKLDWIIEQFSRKPVPKMDVYTRNILRMGLYQILYLGSVPSPVACSESVELAKRFGHSGMSRFVNGVLRALVRGLESLDFPTMDEDPVLHISVMQSHPEWLVRRWVDRFGKEEALELCRANNQVPPTVVRVNTLKTSPEELSVLFTERGIAVQPSTLVPEALRISNYDSVQSLPGFEEGLFYVQDESAALASHILSPAPGDFVLDVCGAPGGKTTHVAALMQNQGRVLTVDLSESKLCLVQQACNRFGIDIVQACVADASRLDEVLSVRADRILLDAPCSGFGVLRRKPEIRWHRTSSDIANLAELQSRMLDSVARCLKPGGSLVYCTCTIEPEENTRVVNGFLETHTEFSYDPLASYLPRASLVELFGDTIHYGYLHLFPHIHDVDGFFISRLVKKP
jgi:16S rRNA (cytosine967-C5)-methyltransferase